MSARAALPCLLCGAVMDNVLGVEGGVDNQPYAGTEFTTLGHYGSTFWDSFDNEELVINICDFCLAARTDRLGLRHTHDDRFVRPYPVGNP
jgi:hypothetical protein